MTAPLPAKPPAGAASSGHATMRKLAIVLGIAAAIVAFFIFDFGQYLTLDFLKSQRTALLAVVDANPLRAGVVYGLIYVAIAGLSLPGAALMTLAGGALFGLVWATVLVSFASSIGATIALLASRFVLRDFVIARFGDRLAAIERGVERDGAFYLFALRLVPAIPFFVVNLAMGLTRIRAGTFYWISQLGMLPATVVYVYAGTELGKIDSLASILSPGLIAAFTLLGVFPLVARWFVNAVQSRRRYARFARPARFERDVVVIGAGSAGLVAAYLAAAVRAKVTLVEKERMGGDCLNTGCVPSKTLIRSARLLAQTRRAGEFGVRCDQVEGDFGAVMERVRKVVRAIEPHDSVERYAALGVECLQGSARITSPWAVEVTTAGAPRTLTTRSVIIAAGARPVIPAIPGLAAAGPLTSDTVWNLRELPRRLVVLGGGPIGCELAQCFARFGAEVTLVEMAQRVLPREDADASQLVSAQLATDGVRVLTAHRAHGVAMENGAKQLIVDGANGEQRIPFDEVLCAVGRRPNIAGYGLEELGIAVGSGIETNEFLQTSLPNIYACGDVTGQHQFTHFAASQARHAAFNALFGSLRRARLDASIVPWCTFTEPEVARVGLNEDEARSRGIAHEVALFDLRHLDRAITDGEDRGFVKVLTRPGSDRILGAAIVGERAGDLLPEFVLAMRERIGLKRILNTIHVYPTFGEAVQRAAGAWRQAQVTRAQQDLLAAFHDWRRGDAGFARVLRAAFALATGTRSSAKQSSHSSQSNDAPH